MINLMGTLSLFFILNPTFIHHLLIVVFSGQNMNLNLFLDKNMVTKNARCKYATINPKAQAIFVHVIVNVIFKYMLQVKYTKNLSNNNFGVLSHIKVHYGCYEIVKNGNLYIHTLL
jgi:NADH:ubiquinone oxidoreductase subunit 6 (subunit J)